jgi:SAM-dependent methyltransferase
MEQQRPSDWFVTAFGELYPLLYAHRDDASAAREALDLFALLGPRGRDARILDLCCGAGRHAAALAAGGARVVGMDLSPELLARAARRLRLAGRLVRGDMRHLPFGPAFDLVLNLFTSFGYFRDDAENEQAVREMARVLVPRGTLVIDHVNRARLRRDLVPEDTRMEHGLVVRQRRELRGERIRKEITVRCEDGRQGVFVEDVRLYRPEELAAMLAAAGLEAPRFRGSLAGAPFGPESPRMVVIAEKARG